MRGRRCCLRDQPVLATRTGTKNCATGGNLSISGLFTMRRGQPSRRLRLESLVDRLQLPREWTVDELVTSVERMRGRRIVRSRLPDSVPVGLCGLWLARAKDDVVLYRESSDPMMERHVVAHEVAHMLLGHGRKTSPRQLATLLVGGDVERELGSGASLVQTARGAGAYDDIFEYEAELLATLILTGDRRKGILRRYRISPAL